MNPSIPEERDEDLLERFSSRMRREVVRPLEEKIETLERRITTLVENEVHADFVDTLTAAKLAGVSGKTEKHLRWNFLNWARRYGVTSGGRKNCWSKESIESVVSHQKQFQRRRR